MTNIDRRSFTFGAMALGAAAAMTGPAARAATAMTRDADVIVIGAGVSGLNTAWLLEQEGLKVMVLEGRQRVGGRIHTLFDLPGTPEMGFNTMGDGYGRGLDAASRAGVKMVEVGHRWKIGKPQGMVFRGQHLSREAWAAAPFNPLPDAMKTMMPWEVVNTLVATKGKLADWTAWLDPENAALDISMHSFLRAQGLNDAAIALVNDVSPYYGTNAYDISALMLEYNSGFIKTQLEAGLNSWAVKGGNELLPRGMAGLLKRPVLLDKDVVAMDDDGKRVEVRCADGSVYRAGHVVSSVPLATLRNIHLTNGFTGAQAEAVTNMAHQQVATAFVTSSAPFWEEDGLAPGMWTDSSLGTVMPQRFGASGDEVTGFLVQARGRLAQSWDRIGKEATLAQVIAKFEELRPAAKGKLKAHALHSWAAEHFNGGAWAYFRPGEISRLGTEIALPHGRIHFCGEHTAVGARGIEGALESSERVAIELLSL
jgi:monoamine oxidase